jgi:hypothetical protein
MSRIFAAFLLIAVLAIGGSAIAATAYQAGLTTAVAQIPADGTTVVTPIVVPGYGYGLPGFGFLGFLGTIFFLILVFGLLRAIFGRGRGHGHGWGHGGAGGWGPGGPGGPGGSGGANGPGWSNGPWQARAHQTFDEWHRDAHGPNQPTASSSGTDRSTSASTDDASSSAPA